MQEEGVEEGAPPPLANISERKQFLTKSYRLIKKCIAELIKVITPSGGGDPEAIASVITRFTEACSALYPVLGHMTIMGNTATSPVFEFAFFKREGQCSAKDVIILLMILCQ